ncbi:MULTISPECIES: 2OG-Fe(II) oxygenase family protein [unclassified Francisella]|uniref:2OG-Fe(II) oxygenase family protein n=1 Tax=unclassified Francisella TaxID=2610885 RepID=UPI002E3520D1|nr:MULTISPECIES: 2OG-Fe(II) oxygenase family protein [unclassified Francisella]MED7819376.1 2OG-Fe(II) oxygenase family protein [Francisella sp. 19S2-4]MED7830167.1 2OG-Fe(II) oxygenase family protein [Francisella sp. 19S2-10]
MNLTKDQFDLLIKEGCCVTDIPALSGYENLANSLKSFILREKSYKDKYLQKNFSKGFDGYSYLGQQDSTNQGATDLLHSFVLSNLHESSCFPIEFKEFLLDQWSCIYKQIQLIEKAVISSLNSKILSDIYENMAHMVSCNFYPEVEGEMLSEPLRLTEHTDISLFTIFPFGTSEGLEYKNSQGQWQKIPASDKVTIFNGYFMNYWSNGKFTACDHRVNLDKKMTKERASFAFFSIPHPQQDIKLINDSTASAQKYYDDYLALFS